MKLLREVEEKVNRPFAVKLDETKEVIRHHLEEFGDKVAVAFSGGKDSEVVLYLCLEINPNIPVVFNNTGVEYPDTVRFIAELEERWNLNLIVTHPEKTFWDCIEQYGFPKSSKRKGHGNKAYCCYWLKEKPMLLAIRENNWLGYFTGETAIESRLRMFAALKGTCLHLKRERVCKIKPILWWTKEEVWHFIHKEGLPINGAYAKGAHRVGCAPCTAYKSWETGMREMSPKLYRLIKLRKDNQYVMLLEEWPTTSYRSFVDNTVNGLKPRHVTFLCPANHRFTLARAVRKKTFTRTEKLWAGRFK
jgi:phosphoadenosine phosphosulfate reductase